MNISRLFRLGVSSVQTNRSECNALVRAYIECAQFVVQKENTASTFLADHVSSNIVNSVTALLFINLTI